MRGGRVLVTDDQWGKVEAIIALDPDRFDNEALLGLDGFSHAEIIFRFDRLPREKIGTGARRPRGRMDWPRIRIFAQRGKNRPNRLGLTTYKIIAIEGANVHVRGLDAVDGTQVLDIKPVMRGFTPREAVREPDLVSAIMQDYW